MHPHHLRRQTIGCLLNSLLALLLFGALIAQGHAATLTTAPADKPAQRTFLIYMIGSDLESDGEFGSADLEEMLSVAPDDNVHVVIQTGGSQAAGWDRVRRFHVKNQMLQERANLGKLNMGTEAALADFLSWGTSQFPAQQTTLIFWSHGSGAVNLGSTGFGVVGPDEIHEDSLSLAEIERALRRLKDSKGTQFELIGFDACLMGALEVAQTLRPYTRYILASQETEPGGGWNYASWLAALRQRPTMSTETLGQTIIDSFFASHKDQDGQSEALTLSLLDLGELPSVTAAAQHWARLAQTLVQRGSEPAWALARARADAENYGRSGRFDLGMVDLHDFVQHSTLRLIEIAARSPAELSALGSELQASAAALQTAIGKVVVRHRSTANRPRARGLSVFVPNTFHILNADHAKVMRAQLAALDAPADWKALLTSYVKQISSAPRTLEIGSVRRQGRSELVATLNGNPDQAMSFHASLITDVPGVRPIVLSNAMLDEESQINANKLTHDLSESGFLMFEGVPVFTELIDDSERGSILGIPVQVNGQEGEIQVEFTLIGRVSSYRVLGFLPSNAQARGKPKALQAGQQVQLLHPELPVKPSDELHYIAHLAPITLKSAFPSVSTGLPGRGSYALGFFFLDAEGRLVPSRQSVAHRVP